MREFSSNHSLQVVLEEPAAGKSRHGFAMHVLQIDSNVRGSKGLLFGGFEVLKRLWKGPICNPGRENKFIVFHHPDLHWLIYSVIFCDVFASAPNNSHILQAFLLCFLQDPTFPSNLLKLFKIPNITRNALQSNSRHTLCSYGLWV